MDERGEWLEQGMGVRWGVSRGRTNERAAHRVDGDVQAETPCPFLQDYLRPPYSMVHRGSVASPTDISVK